MTSSTTEAEFVAANDGGKMMLYTCSLLYDLHIPQEVVSIMYEDNNDCIDMVFS